MNERMTRIMNYEKRLLQDRMQLQLLIEESDACDTEMIKSKINHFKQEIEYMEQQLEYLTSDLDARTYEENISPEKPAITQPEQTIISTPEPVQNQEEATVASEIQKKDLEKTIGKSLMGIVASVLIFISLLMFATVLLPYFNDTAKMITSYLLSFAFLGAGLIKLRKDQDNKFYIALTGCGIGAVYISLLLSNMYFKVIGDITLYVLICIWAIGVCVLSKIKNKIFQIIGQLGIVIAMIFGCVLCIESEDATKFMALVIFYIISSGVFYYVHYDREFSNNLIHHIFNAINFVVLFEGCSDILGEGIFVTTIIVLVFIAFHMGMAIYSRLEKTGASFGIILGIYVYVFICIMALLAGKNDLVFAIASYIVSMVIMILVEWKRANITIGKNIAILAMVIFAVYGLGVHNILYENGIVPLMILPWLFLGFYRNNSILKYSSITVLFMYVTMDYVNEVQRLLFGLVAVVSAFGLIYKNKDQYSARFKGMVHIVTFIFLSVCVDNVLLEMAKDYEVSGAVSFAVAAVFNIAMLKSCFGKNLATDEREKGSVYNILNMYVMIGGLVRIEDGYEGILHLVIIIVTLIAFMINAKNLLDKYDNKFAGIYVGLKFTVLMIVILNSFDSANYVISIACFILAILSIMLGFVGQYKSLRVFGLILSMISTFKLIMVDINYSNTLGNALSFFASGILCFVISLIYNFIDKKMQKD